MMMDADAERTPAGPGSIASGDEAAARLRPTGYDPLRGRLLALAERCEAAKGPDKNLDWDIAEALSLPRPLDASFSISLDAAMTLVPEGTGFNITRYWIATSSGPVWSAEIATGGVPDKPRQVFDCYDAASPGLALCAAALRARARDSDTHPKGGDASGSGSAE